jgi:membrane fusion protein (multidrug efflux system)
MKKQFDNLRNQWRGADRVSRLGILIVACAAMTLFVMVIARHLSYALEARTLKHEADAGPRVLIALASLSAPEQTLSLLGEARPYESATLYAKVSGYLRDVRVDKGDIVKEGQLLARIESPETTQQYTAALADAKNKRAIAERYKPLLEKKLVSQQEADQAFADAQVAEANVQSLGAIKGYQEIRAPFSGVVTARYVDPGALIQNAQNAQTGAQPLFTVAQVDHLRVYAYVDQKYAALIHNGLPVTITLPERPEVAIPAIVTRFSGALDEKTRMLLVEVDIDNTKGQVVAGSYVQVSLKVRSPSYIEVPVEALVLKDAKDFVPVVSSSHTVTYRSVNLADNDGQHVKVLSGLAEGEMVALNLGNSLDEGSPVQPIMPSPK